MAGNLSRGNDLNIGQGKMLKAITALSILFLLLPLIILVIFSFNESRNVTQWSGFSVKWYLTVFRDAGLWMAVKNSLVIAIISTLFTTILGTICAILLARYRFRGRELFQNLLYVPVILPEIIFGVALLALFLLIRFPLGILSVICAHITFSFPFAAMIILAKVINLPASLEEASLDLGASRWQTFIKVVLPNISPGVVSGALFAFTLSIDDFIVTFFTAGVGASTLPLKIYSLIKFGITPAINAVSTILIVFTIAALYLTNLLQKSERIGRRFKLILGGIFLFLIALVIAAPMFSSNQKKLNIYNYSGYLDEQLVKDFEDQTGIDVSVDFYNDNEELYSRLRMGVTGYDLVIPSGYMVKILKSEGLISPINLAAIPNYSFIDHGFRKMVYDTTGQYYIPYAYGYTAIVYNSEMIDEPVTSWKSMWDERYRGKITMVDDMQEVFFAAYTLLGYKVDKDTARLLQARDLLIRQKPLLKKYESTAIETMMLNGDIWIAHAWNGMIARLLAADPRFRPVLPEEGFLFWTDNLCIPSSSQHRENAELFINFLLKPENSARNIKTIAYAMPNDSAKQLLDPSIRDNRVIFPEIGDFSKLNLNEDLGDFKKMMDKAWTELKVR